MIQGIAASLLASALFGAIYYLSVWLVPLAGEEIFGWRVLCTLPFTTALLAWRGEGPQVRALWQRVRARPPLGLLLLVSAALLGVQLWLFMWAPPQGRALPVSLGYFLLPLVMVLAGRVVYRERLSTAHAVAAVLAAGGVAAELWRVVGAAGATGLSWEVWLVALGYTVYFVLRRELATEGLAGHWLDMALMLPAALWFILREPSSWHVVAATPRLWLLVPALGVISAAALALYMAAHRLLPLGLFGLLSYVEPVLLVAVAWLLGERVATGQGWVYGPILAAVAVLAADGAWRVLRERRAAGPTDPAH